MMWMMPDGGIIRQCRPAKWRNGMDRNGWVAPPMHALLMIVIAPAALPLSAAEEGHQRDAPVESAACAAR